MAGSWVSFGYESEKMNFFLLYCNYLLWPYENSITKPKQKWTQNSIIHEKQFDSLPEQPGVKPFFELKWPGHLVSEPINRNKEVVNKDQGKINVVIIKLVGYPSNETNRLDYFTNIFTSIT